MKKNIFFLILCTLAYITPAFSADIAEADKFAKGLADDIMVNVVKSKAPLEEKQQSFRKTFLSAVDLKTAARFTLGRYARTATPEQIQTYTDALTDNIIYTWTKRFSDYAGDEIVFKGSRKSESGDFYITSSIELPETQNNVEVIWRIVDKKGTLKLADLVVEGVSMLMSYRNEYTSILQQNGGDVSALVAQMQKKNETLKKSA